MAFRRHCNVQDAMDRHTGARTLWALIGVRTNSADDSALGDEPGISSEALDAG